MPTVTELLETLQSGKGDDPDAEWRAAIALGEVAGEERQQAVSGLLTLLQGGQAHALTRSHAVEALGRLGDAQAIPTLLTALNDSYRLVRAYSAAAVGRMATSADAVPPLLERLENDPYFGVRAEAVGAAAAIALRLNDAALRQQVRAALNARLAVEKANPAAGTERVVAEIERALTRL